MNAGLSPVLIPLKMRPKLPCRKMPPDNLDAKESRKSLHAARVLGSVTFTMILRHKVDIDIGAVTSLLPR